MKWDAKKLFQILPFYNTFIEKPEIKKLSNINLLQELPFYYELSIQMHLVDMQEVIKLTLFMKKILYFS